MAYFRREIPPEYLLPFAGAGVIFAVVFFLLKKTSPEKPSPASEKQDGGISAPERNGTLCSATARPRTEEAEKKTPVSKNAHGQTKRKPFEKLRKSLAQSRSGLLSKLEKIVSSGKLSKDLWEEFEELLVLADTGVSAAMKIRERIEKRLSRDDLKNYEKVKKALICETKEILKKPARGETEAYEGRADKPDIVMLVGVNGVGKTTTAGKLARFMRLRDKKVMLAATDTFRAAAAEQLEAWADRSKSFFIKGAPGADPSGIAFDAVKTATAKNCDAVIIDTAGRLHTKTGLMDELSKIKRVVGKAHEGGPREVFLVLDATTGQNAISQTRMFDEAVGVTGIVLTKLDGTAKGGVLIAIAEQLEIPVRYVGTGEGMDDLDEFDAGNFVSALFDETG